MATKANKKPYKKSWLYSVVKAIYAAIFHGLFGGRIRRLASVPAQGPLILMCNHIHIFDPLTLWLCLPKRQMHVIAKKELFKYRIVGGVLRRVHAFPVGRGQFDLSAMRTCMQILQADEVLGIFPEGTRGNGEEIAELLSGAAVVALKSKAAVVPIYVRGKYRLGGRLRAVVGAPIPIDDLRAQGADKDGSEAFLQRMRETLEGLKAESEAF